MVVIVCCGMGSVADELGNWETVEVTMGSKVLVSVGTSCLVCVGGGEVIGVLGVAVAAVSQPPISRTGRTKKIHTTLCMAKIIPDRFFRLNKFAYFDDCTAGR